MREARIANLVRLIEFVYEPDPVKAYDYVHVFLEYAGPLPRSGVTPFDSEHVSWLQTEARKHIHATVAGKPWHLRLSDLEKEDPSFSFRIEPSLRRGLFCHYGNLKAITLWTLANILAGREGERLIGCAEPGCEVIFVKRKRGTYCRAHRSGKDYARRHRQAAKQSPNARHERYVRHVARTKGNSVAAHVRKARRKPKTGGLHDESAI
jgi:hypothetical protein